jgi:flagellar basal-body rod protein FlgB
MALYDTTQLGLEAAMRASAARQQAIAQNIANVNTPGYRRRDVDFGQTLSALMNEGDGKALQQFTPTAAVDNSAPVRTDGNSVDIDHESAAESSNGIYYESLVAVAQARIDIIQSALGVK